MGHGAHVAGVSVVWPRLPGSQSMNEAPGPGCSLGSPGSVCLSLDHFHPVTSHWCRSQPSVRISHMPGSSPHLTFCSLQYTLHRQSEGHSQPVDSVSLAGAGHLLDPGPDLGSFASPWPGLNMTRTRVTDDQHPD